MKCRVTPSQRLSTKPYQVWAVLEKDSDTKPGGAIKSAYCTCTAGLHGSCNHIAGLLFRIKAAVLRGITKPTCTDRLAMWKVPSAKTELTPCPVSELIFKKDHYGKTFSVDRDRQDANIKGRMSFSPLSAEQEVLVKDEDAMRKKLYELIKPYAPKSCFSEFMEEKKLNVKVKYPTPMSLLQCADHFKINQDKSIQENVKLFTENIALTEKERNAVFENTVGQASIQEWHDQRKGRLTASRFHQICTRSKSLQASSSTDANCLVSTLLGYNKALNTAALKHGQSMEPHAKANYLSVAKKNHRKLVSTEAGLVIMPEKPFIAVSPDLLIECLCCGQGLVEIKCPYSIRDTTPSSSNLAYLEEIKGKTTLKKNSDYYYQIQGQMAVTGRAYTDLVVFTTHGNFIKRINFDELFWQDMLIKLEWFWVNCLCPEVLYKTIKQQKDTVSQSLSASSTKCLPENENCGTTSSS